MLTKQDLMTTKDFTNVQCAHRLLPGTRQVGSLALPNTMQHVLGNCLQCDSDSLFELLSMCSKKGDINQALHISPEKKL